MGVLSRIGCTLLLISILPLDVRGQGRPAVAAGGRAPVALTIGGEVARPLRLTAEDLAELPRQTVRGLLGGSLGSDRFEFIGSLNASRGQT